MKNIKTVLSGMVLVVGCANTELGTSARIVVDQPNKLGVTALEVDRADDGMEIEVRGIDEQGAVRGMMHRRIGSVPDLAQVGGAESSGDDTGTEVTFLVGGQDARMITRGTELIRMGMEDNPIAKPFLEIDAVRDVLSHNRFDIVTGGGAGEISFSTQTCPGSVLNTSPYVTQCCLSLYGGYYFTLFVNPSNQLVRRDYNTSGWAGCRASDGVSGCSGQACYYGPNGFARAQIWGPSGYPYVYSVAGGAFCQGSYYPYPITPAYGSLSGSFPTGQNCPGGASGPAWDWDY